MTINVKDSETELSAPVKTITAAGEHVPVRAAHGDNTAYLTAQSGLASFNGSWIDCINFPFISLLTTWTAVGGTNGTLMLQGTDDPAQADASIETFGDFNTAVTVFAGYAAWKIKNPPAYLRVIYTRTAGGGANQFAAWYTRRSA